MSGERLKQIKKDEFGLEGLSAASKALPICKLLHEIQIQSDCGFDVCLINGIGVYCLIEIKSPSNVFYGLQTGTISQYDEKDQV
jgi:hypothetical protein